MGRVPCNKSPLEIRKMKVESRKRHQHRLRRAMAISDCLLLTATEQHRQATAFVDKLEQKYPGKRDVRKTPEFKNWYQNQLLNIYSPATDQTQATNSKEEINDVNVCEKEINHTNVSEKETVLRIPLISINAKEKSSEPVQEEQLTSIFDDIPNDVMKQLIDEIRADPELDAFMNEFGFEEEVLDEGNIHHEIDIGLNVEIDDRLEDELNSLVCF